MDTETRKHRIDATERDRKRPRVDPDPKLLSVGTASDHSFGSLQQLLDFSALKTATQISDRFDEVAKSLLHDHYLVLRRDELVTEFEILELEFYLQKAEVHEDPFTHGSEEQRISGRWYFHRVPRRSADSHRSSTSLSGYRGGSRKGIDLTIGAAPNSSSGQPLLRGGVLLRSLRRVSDSKVISGPSLLVDQILLLSKAGSISELVEQMWNGEASAFSSASSSEMLASLYLEPAARDAPRKRSLYRSPRIGLDLSHPGTTSSPSHPRIIFLPKRYRYFVHPELLTANGRPQTFLGVLYACLETGRYGESFDSVALRHELIRITSLKEQTIIKYLGYYKTGIDGGNLKSFVGPPGKGASASLPTLLNMMGTLERLCMDEKAKQRTSPYWAA